MFDAKVNTLKSIAPFELVKTSTCNAGHVAYGLFDEIFVRSRTGKLNKGSAKV